MSVVVIGLNHRTVPLDLLERMTIDEARLPKALAVILICATCAKLPAAN